MEDPSGMPTEIIEAGELIRNLMEKPLLTRAEKDLINAAKLKIAYWACSVEKLPASRENLIHVLGPDAKDIMNRYDANLEHAKEERRKSQIRRTSARRKGDSSGFWENA